MEQPALVNRLQQTLGHGGTELFNILPVQLRNLLNDKLWLQCTDKNGNLFTNFETFVTHRLPQGLDTTVEDLLHYCRRKQYADVRELIRRESPAAKEHGGDRRSEKDQSQKDQGSNATLKPERGATYNLRRLKRDRPDLAEKVISGDLSANAAAIQAGFRVKSITVPIDTAEHALKPLVKVFGVAKLAKALLAMS